MIHDKFVGFYISLVEKEKERLRSGIFENPCISIEELRRTQGIYEGLEQALNLLRDSIEKADT